MADINLTQEIVYTVGFAMNIEQDAVVLLKKDRGPSFNVGKWNGVGGKVELGEGIRTCMSREFHQEAGILIPSDQWYGYHIEKHLPRAEQTLCPRIHFLVAHVEWDLLEQIKSMSSEEVRIFSIEDTLLDTASGLPFKKGQDYVYNMGYLLSMAKCWLQQPQHHWIEG